jgi:hypothetical protein
MYFYDWTIILILPGLCWGYGRIQSEKRVCQIFKIGTSRNISPMRSAAIF